MYLDQITNDELADVGRLAEMSIRAGLTVLRTVTQYKAHQMTELAEELKEYRLANPLIPKGDISDLSYFWAADSLPRQMVREMPERTALRLERLLETLEQQGAVHSGADGWTLTGAGRKLIYDKNFVQDALKTDVEFADKLKAAAARETARRPAADEAAWKNVGAEIRWVKETAAENPKEAVKSLQQIARGLKRDKATCGGELHQAVDEAMREIVVDGKPVAETIAAMLGKVGDKADELLINYNDLTMRTGNEVRHEATKAAMNAKAAVAATPVIGIAEALVARLRKTAHQITR